MYKYIHFDVNYKSTVSRGFLVKKNLTPLSFYFLPSKVLYLADSANVPQGRRGGYHDEDDDNGDHCAERDDDDDDGESDDVVPTRHRSPSSPFFASSSEG